MQKTCIIIPCFNESERIPLDAFKHFLAHNSYSIYFVNDGSEDNTLDLLLGLKRLYPEKVEVKDLSRNSGKAEAVRQGFLEAISAGVFDCVGYMDADLATPLEEIEYLHNYFREEIEVVIGARVKRLGAIIERDPVRHYLGRIFATTASIYLDIHAYDSQCGAKFFRISTAKKIFIEPFSSNWLFDLEVLYRLKNEDSVQFQRNILEVPLRTWREKGNSKVKMWDFMTAPLELFKIKSTNRRIKKAN